MERFHEQPEKRKIERGNRTVNIDGFEYSRWRQRSYKMDHRRLIRFIDQATIPQSKLFFNEYVRAENLVLKQLYRVIKGKVQLTSDEKIQLAKKAIKLQKWHTNAISILSPWQIVKYANHLAAQTHISLGPTRTPKKKMTSLKYQERLLEIIQAHQNWDKQTILEAIRELYPTVDKIFIFELLRNMGFWDVRKKRQGIPWKEWLKKHEGVTWGGDFFSVYVWTEKALVKYDILFFIHLETLRVVIGGISANATEEWLINILKSWTDGFCPLGPDAKFLVRDRDRRYTKNTDWYLASIGICPKRIAAGAPVMNCVSEQFVNHIRHDCLSHCVFLTEEAFYQVISKYVEYYHKYRPHKKHNGGYIMPQPHGTVGHGTITHVKILDGLLATYCYQPENT